MDPYAKPKEPRVGEKRPKLQHVAEDPVQGRTRSERQAEKQAVAAERRAIKKSARRHLQKEMISDLEEISSEGTARR
ncbi:hypothetical protein BH20VER1_BH20VER1_00010 [soil metagenome]